MNLKCTTHDCSRRNTCRHYATSIIDGFSEQVHPVRSLIRADRDYVVEPEQADLTNPPMILACNAYQSRYYALPIQQELIFETRLKSFKSLEEQK